MNFPVYEGVITPEFEGFEALFRHLLFVCGALDKAALSALLEERLFIGDFSEVRFVTWCLSELAFVQGEQERVFPYVVYPVAIIEYSESRELFFDFYGADDFDLDFVG